VHSRAGAGMFSLQIDRISLIFGGRACPPVPELTYPFCTRPEPTPWVVLYLADQPSV
jgi:hypothetical protein